MTEPSLSPFLAGLAFPECPRWRDGALWFCDFYTHQVLRATPDGRVTTVAEVHCEPGGDDGRTLFVLTTRVMITPEESLKQRLGANRDSAS